MKLKIGFSIGSLLNTKDIRRFSSHIDKNENIDSIWVPESWGKEAFSILGAISQVTKRVKLRNIHNKYLFSNTCYNCDGSNFDR